MSDDILALALRFNLCLAVAIALVFLVRAPMRRWFGAQIAYALWLIPPLAAATVFLPARIVTVIVPAAAASTRAPPPMPLGASVLTDLAPHAIDFTLLSLTLWICGAVLSFLLLAGRQQTFLRGLGRLTPRRDWGADVFSAESKDAGPAVIGVLRPLIVAPADFETRYSEEERRVVLAHERAHMAQGDPLINASAALLQCVNWFNPLIHLAVRALRADQEFACDASVLAREETARRLYAEALFKTRLAGAEIPLGCAWPAATLDAFKERIRMLKRNTPSRMQMLLGASAIGLATATVCAVAWAAQPAHIVSVAETSGDELAGGREGDQPIAQAVREALADAQRDIDDAAHEVASEEDIMPAALAEAQMEIHEESQRIAREATDEALRESSAEREEAEREAMEDLHQALIESRAEMREEARFRGRVLTQNSEAMAEIRRHAEALTADATRMVRLDTNLAANQSIRAAIEEDMASHEAAIETLSAQIEAAVEARMEADD